MSGENKFESFEAVCPFYKCEYTRVGVVVCEGIHTASSIALRFADAQTCRSFKKECCYSDYGKCEIYQTILRGYEDG